MKLTRKEELIIAEAAAIIQRKNAVKIVRTKRAQVSGLMERLKVGTVTFIKLNGNFRNLEFERSEQGTSKRDLDLGTKYLTVFDTEKGEFRKVNLETVLEIKANGVLYKVVG